MKSYKKAITVIIILSCFQSLSCNRDQSLTQRTTDRYLEHLRNSLEKIQVNWNIYPGSSEIYEPLWLLSPEDCDLLIVTDSENTLFLLNKDGKVLSKTGGKGRGPSEFQSIFRPHIGSDNRLYVIDGLLFQISIYEIEDGSLSFIESVRYKNPETHSLDALYITDSGKYGVYQESANGFFSPENRFFLYRLNEDIGPEAQLLEMPGHKRDKVKTPDFTFFAPHQYGSKTLWSFNQNRFYYITTVDESIYAYHLDTGKKDTLSFIELEERSNSRQFIEAVKKSIPEEDQEYLSTLEELKTLPFFSGFYADEQRFLLTLLSIPSEDGMILYTDRQSGEVKYFEVPEGFTPQSACGNTIYGINVDLEKGSKIMAVDLLM